ncbi:protease 3 precursor [bacterium BMS3Bbin02]|nr:protease 3 precursor [bacterium BMS3Bbin02]
MHYSLTTLDNGLRIITQDMASASSVSVGVWVDAGSRDEVGPQHGTSHFLEHLLFKGSERMSARHISEALDAIGAQHNAFTSKEYTCYWARIRATDTPLAVDILAEMVRQPAFRQAEIDSERHVVLEEINMNEDDPSDVAHEQFVKAMWAGHPIQPAILGTRDSINAMTRDTIQAYWAERYTPGSVVIAAAGRLDHDEFVALIAKHFGAWEGVAPSRALQTMEVRSAVKVVRRDTEQAHLVLGMPGYVRDDDRRYAHLVVDHILGGGMSSRLFEEIREQRGLAYAVHSFRMPFVDTGASAIYVGTTPSQAAEVLKLVRSELAKLVESGITSREITRAKGHVKGSMALALEDATSRMTRLGRSELIGLDHISVDEIVARVEAVTLNDALEVASDVYAGPFVLGAVGPFDADGLREFVA